MKTLPKLAFIALVIIIGLSIYYSGETGYPNKQFLFQDYEKIAQTQKVELDFNPSNVSPKVCGITKNGLIYLSGNALTGYQEFTVVVLPERGLAQNQMLSQAGAKIYYPMLKQGDYYLAKPDTIYPNSLYYFLSSTISGIASFPTDKADEFTECKLIKNNYGEYAIRAN